MDLIKSTMVQEILRNHVQINITMGAVIIYGNRRGMVEFSDSGALKFAPPPRRGTPKTCPPLKVRAFKFCPGKLLALFV